MIIKAVQTNAVNVSQEIKLQRRGNLFFRKKSFSWILERSVEMGARQAAFLDSKSTTQSELGPSQPHFWVVGQLTHYPFLG
jgi:hypothetical protein